MKVGRAITKATRFGLTKNEESFAERNAEEQRLVGSLQEADSLENRFEQPLRFAMRLLRYCLQLNYFPGETAVSALVDKNG